MSKESLNERHIDYLFQKPAFRQTLKNLVKKISSKIKDEDVEQLVNDAYVKVKSRIYSKDGLNLEENTVERMAAYCKKTIERLALDLVRSSRYSREVFTTDTGWKGGHVTGDEVSTEDVASRGWGSRPSSLEDRVLLLETERMFDSPGKELGNRKDKGDIRRVLDQYGGMNEVNPTSPDSATFVDVAKERIKEESGLDWDLEMMKAKEDPSPMSRKHRIDALEDMLETKTNTLGRKTMRGWDSLNEWADKTDFSKNSGFNMMKDLVKVANKLDSVGLTKEADQIDGLIRKMAADSETGYDEFYTMWNSLSNEEKDNLNFKTRKFQSYYDSFCKDPESDLGRWDESLYLEYVGEEGYPTPTEERKEEILKEVKRKAKGALLRSEKIDIEENAIARDRPRHMSLFDSWMMPPPASTKVL